MLEGECNVLSRESGIHIIPVLTRAFDFRVGDRTNHALAYYHNVGQAILLSYTRLGFVIKGFLGKKTAGLIKDRLDKVIHALPESERLSVLDYIENVVPKWEDAVMELTGDFFDKTLQSHRNFLRRLMLVVMQKGVFSPEEVRNLSMEEKNHLMRLAGYSGGKGFQEYTMGQVRYVPRENL